MTLMLTQVEIENVRGIATGRLHGLTELVVLVGPNGCGKSSVLDAIHIGASPRPVEACQQALLRIRSEAGAGYWFPRSGADKATVITESGTQRRVTRIERALSTAGRLELVLSVTKAGTVADFATLATFASDGTLAVASVTPHIAVVLPDVNLVEFPAHVPLYKLYNEAINQGRAREISALVSELLKRDVNLAIKVSEVEGRDTPYLGMDFHHGAVPVDFAGTGVHACVNIAAHLASRREGAVLLEEPEVHLHPAAVRLVARTLWLGVKRGIQVILSTHSLELIDYLLAERDAGCDLLKLTVYSVRLPEDGCLRVSRIPGDSVERLRNGLDEELR
jgi:hypothetical protein